MNVNAQSRIRSRGVAMLLVLVSLMMATILTAAYVASRDNSATIGANVANSATARWVADSGLDVGLTILQTKANWRQEHDGGTLVRDFPVMGGTLNIDVIDVETGIPPDANTENVRLTARGLLDGVEQSASAIAYVPVDTSVDVDLSEFALFATQGITLTDDALITRWPMAPQTTLGRPISLGTRATNAFSVSVDGNAAVIDGRAFYPITASSSIIAVSNDSTLVAHPIGDLIPTPLPPV
ncbi:MAG: hypothetical protein L0Y42_12770, partial [Phycisphaerales bacterium]|nr:hypothetical protein [Phycisphaerales bacterium]